MVWFQCEDCGENLKKPKLSNHFRICSATKLSCIDCGEMFGQQAVQGHTQCITEAEKYGPKGQGRASNAPPAKSSNKDAKQQPDFDIKVGLSERPPWFCSLCNTKATSEQTLLLHAEGKKHRAKARGFYASKQPPKQGEGSAPNAALPSENGKTTETGENEHVDEAKNKNVQKDHDTDNIAVGVENGSKKKRKHDASGNVAPDADGNQNGEVVQAETYDSEAKKAKKCTGTAKDTLQKMKWKKLIKSSLKTSSDGTMKIKKLKKLLVEVMKESGISVAETQLDDTLEQKINSSKRFVIDGRYVRLAVKD